MQYAVLFDMDGVLVDNNPYHVKAWMIFCRQRGIKVTPEEISSHFGNTNRDYFTFLLKRDVSMEEADMLGEEKEAIYRKIYADTISPLNGLHELLDQLKMNNFKIALVTSAPTENVDFTIDKLGIRKYFDAVVDATNIRKGKPDPEIYLTAAGQLAISPGHCLVFEDSVHGIAAAVKAGMTTVGVLTSNSREHLAAAKYHITDFSYITIPQIQQLLNHTGK